MKVMIIGAGKLGYKLSELMVAEGIDVTVIDNNPQVIEFVNEHLDVLTVVSNGMDISKKKKKSIKEYGLLVTTTHSDEANALI